uniref:Transforming growth factor beta superfamily signaling ligand n=1 Tax=Phallusia mammillata TaxID=59560 RepID=A0A6F9D6Y2_9ASCI|nr:transforming growth factor beta superfamily signaling ligand [Phallusia mammillata]
MFPHMIATNCGCR